MKRWGQGLLIGMVGLCAGCVSLPKDALAPSDTLLADRGQQCRKFQTTDEARLLSACSGVLQDLGFILDASEPTVGMLGGSKLRSARDAQNMATAFVLGCLTYSYVPADKEQQFRVSVTTYPAEGDNLVVRVTFQRVVWNTQQQVTRREPIKEPEIYREFFDRLSKAIFLDGQEI